jgi:uncharacterized membrane protein
MRNWKRFRRRNQVPELKQLVRDHFFAGILILIPFAVISWIFGILVQALWHLHDLLPEAWQPENFLHDATLAWFVNVAFLALSCILIAMTVSILGWISKNYIGKKFLNVLADVIGRIPVIRSIYSALDQLLRALATGGGRQFSRVVYIEYPRKGCWALAFVTSEARGPNAPPKHLNVYIPTTPNPTSGFHLIVPDDEVRESHLSVEQAFKTILSLGIAQPDAHGRG